MSQYSLVQRSVTTITSADGAGPKLLTLATAIKLASAYVISTVRDRRRNSFVQRGTVLVSSGGTSPQNVTITAVDLSCARVHISARENRDGQAQGVAAELTSPTNLQLRFYGTVDASENIEISWEVVEDKPRRGAYVRLSSTTQVEIAWDSALVAGETIEVAWEVFDIENVGDDLKELLFRAESLLSLMGSNKLMDNIVYDQAGNIASYRIRLFDTKTNADAATLNVPEADPLQTGERRRIKVTQTIDKAKNDRTDLKAVQTHIIVTPGVD